MQMKRFRVQNYKKVEDTDWVKCDNLTVFVGKNESGKSAIFRGLSKLNPSDGEIYDALKEFPRRRYSEYKNRIWPVSSAEFELEKNEIEKLCEICDPLRKIKSVIVTRFYDDSLKAEFEPKPDIDSLLVKDYLNSIKSWKKQIEKTVAPEGKGEILGQIKNNFNQVFDSTIAKLTDEDELSSVDSTIVKEVTDTLNSNINEEWQQKIFDSVIEENDKLSTRIEKRDDLENAKNWIYENIPQFIYFDKYDVLDSAVHIDRFIQDLNKDTIQENKSQTCWNYSKILEGEVGQRNIQRNHYSEF